MLSDKHRSKNTHLNLDQLNSLNQQITNLTFEDQGLPSPPKVPVAPGEATLKRKQQDLDSAYSNLIDMGNHNCYSGQTINQIEMKDKELYEQMLKNENSQPAHPKIHEKNRNYKMSSSPKTGMKMNKKSFASSLLTNSDLEEVSSMSSNELISIPRSPNSPSLTLDNSSINISTSNMMTPGQGGHHHHSGSKSGNKSIKSTKIYRKESFGSKSQNKSPGQHHHHQQHHQQQQQPSPSNNNHNMTPKNSNTSLTSNHTVQSRNNTPKRNHSNKLSGGHPVKRSSSMREEKRIKTTTRIEIKPEDNCMNYKIGRKFNLYLPFVNGNFTIENSNIFSLLNEQQLLRSF